MWHIIKEYVGYARYGIQYELFVFVNCALVDGLNNMLYKVFNRAVGELSECVFFFCRQISQQLHYLCDCIFNVALTEFFVAFAFGFLSLKRCLLLHLSRQVIYGQVNHLSKAIRYLTQLLPCFTIVCGQITQDKSDTYEHR